MTIEEFWATDAPRIQPKPWMREKKMILVTTDILKEVVDLCISAGRYAHDIETTGLDNRVFEGRTRDVIVGHCLSPDGITGYYIPVRHRKGEQHNLPATLVEEEMRRLGNSDAVAVFFNGTFDHEFLVFCGGEPMGSRWDDHKKWDDAALQAYIYNPKNKDRNLKDLSKLHLGMEMIELKELFPEEYKGKLDFAELDPSDDAVLWYGCSDGICTYLLERFFAERLQDQTGPYLIEKLCVPATRWMERNRVRIDQAKVKELIGLGQIEYYEALVAIYKACEEKLGRSIEPPWMLLLRKNFDPNDTSFDIQDQIDNHKKMAKLRRGLEETVAQEPVRKALQGVLRVFPATYDITSPQQLGNLLEELEVPGLTKTEKSEQVDTSAEVLEELAKDYGHAYPFLPLFSRMRELQKALGTYLSSLRDDVGPDGTIRFRFRQTGADTGRFTAPASKNPALDGGTKFPPHGIPATYDKSRPKCLLRIREAIVAKPGAAILAADLSGVELRIATALSGEPKWFREFFRCSSCNQEFDKGSGQETPPAPPPYCPKCGSDRIGDLHTLTSIVFYGEEKNKTDKQCRQNAKTANFALVYGGGPGALRAATGCDANEAARQYEGFGKTYDVLGMWWQTTRAFGTKYGYVQTAFGRRYPTPELQLPVDSKNCPDPFQRKENKIAKSKAERNATNSPVQGSGADILKLAMGKIYLEFKRRGWLDKARMLLTMHDELVFEIEYDVLGEASRLIPDLMTKNKGILNLRWKIPLTSDVEIGFDYTVPWNLKNFIARRVRRDGVECEFDGTPTKRVWPREFMEVFGPIYGFADDVTPRPKPETPKKVEVHLIEVEELGYGLAMNLAEMLRRVNGTGQYRLEIRLKNGTSLLWPGADFRVDPALCTFKV